MFALLSSWSWSATAGVDVLRIDGGADRLPGRFPAAVPGSWFCSPALDSTAFESNPVFGFICPVLQPGVESFTGLTQLRAGCAIAL